MKINIDMEAWELATVIKGLTINAQPVKETPSGSDVLKEAIVSAFKVPEKITTLPQKTESEKLGCVSKDNLDALAVLLRQKHKTNEIFGESKHREDNPNPNYRPPMGGSHQ